MNTAKKLQLMYDIARRFAEESTCPRAKTGAVVFSKSYSVLVSGYNGSPRGVDHCVEFGCIIVESHCARSSHSEVNAISLAARIGIPIDGQQMFVTHFPCPFCARVILQSGISCVYFAEIISTYSEEHRSIVVNMFLQAGVQLIHWPIVK